MGIKNWRAFQLAESSAAADQYAHALPNSCGRAMNLSTKVRPAAQQTAVLKSTEHIFCFSFKSSY